MSNVKIACLINFQIRKTQHKKDYGSAAQRGMNHAISLYMDSHKN